MYAFVFATFSFAGETLTEKENREAFFFYISLVVSIGTTFTIVRRIKTHRKFSAIGISLPLTFALYVCFELGQIYFNNLNYRETFDKETWIKSESKPFKMAKTLAKEKILVGQTKHQIFVTLGPTNDRLKNDKVDYVKYWTDKGTWELRLFFENGKVVETYLYEEGLSL